MENMELNTHFYRGRRVLVTGHTGFKGSWLTIWLNQLGAVTSGIALDPATDNDLFLLAGLEGSISDHRADIRNSTEVERIIAAEKPETVFHLAAQSLVIRGYRDPVSTFETNLMGTVNVLEACRKSDSVREVIIVTTDKVYENIERPGGYREEDTLGGWDPYSASKACAEIATQSYRRSFSAGTDDGSSIRAICTVRAGNVIGGGDRAADRIIPDCVRALENNDTIILRNPNSIRPWQHVLEPLSGYLQLCSMISVQPQKLSGAWNFGPDSSNAVSVGSLVSEFLNCWGSGRVETSAEMNHYHEAGILLLDASKARNQLNWRPVLSFREAVKLTADWYKSCNSRNAHELCLEQIDYYTRKWNSGSWK